MWPTLSVVALANWECLQVVNWQPKLLHWAWAVLLCLFKRFFFLLKKTDSTYPIMLPVLRSYFELFWHLVSSSIVLSTGSMCGVCINRHSFLYFVLIVPYYTCCSFLCSQLSCHSCLPSISCLVVCWGFSPEPHLCQAMVGPLAPFRALPPALFFQSMHKNLAYWCLPRI